MTHLNSKRLLATLGAATLTLGLTAPLTAQAAEPAELSFPTALSQPNSQDTDLQTDNIDSLIGVTTTQESPDNPTTRSSSGGASRAASQPRPGHSENVPAGQLSEAPRDVAIPGITFLENSSVQVPQQNPTYTSSAVKASPSSQGTTDGISINGVKQDYNAQIPYWCSADNDNYASLHLCYRKTNLFSWLSSYASLGEQLSLISNNPHIIFNDETVPADVAAFLKTGVLQRSMQNWNLLLGKDFFLLKSQLTFTPTNQSGKIVANAERDYIQCLQLSTDYRKGVAASANHQTLNINTTSYNDDIAEFAKKATPGGFFTRGYSFERDNETQPSQQRTTAVGWNWCGSGAYLECTQGSTFEEANGYWIDLVNKAWVRHMNHELGHVLGLTHPLDPTQSTDSRGDYINGPLVMQYNNDSLNSMLDGSLNTSVQYRMIKDSITAGANFLRNSPNGKQPVAQRSIKVTVKDAKGNAVWWRRAPISNSTQRVGYYGAYSWTSAPSSRLRDNQSEQLQRFTNTIAFTSAGLDQWSPTSQLPAVNAPRMSGYKVSVDGGHSWSDTATVPALTLPSITLRTCYYNSARNWGTAGLDCPVTNFGLAKPADVQVIYAPASSVKNMKASDELSDKQSTMLPLKQQFEQVS